MGKRKKRGKREFQGKAPPVTQLDAVQRQSIARTFVYGGRLLRDLFETFVFPRCKTRVPEGTVGLADLSHASVVAEEVAQWAEREIQFITRGARMSVDIKTSVWHGSLNGTHKYEENGVEFELRFPRVFSEIFVEYTIRSAGMLTGRAHLNGTLDDTQYAEVTRNLITAEGQEHEQNTKGHFRLSPELKRAIDNGNTFARELYYALDQKPRK